MQTAQTMYLTDIAASVRPSTDEINDEDENKEDDEPALPQVTNKGVVQALAQVRAFVMQQGENASSKKALQQVIALKNSVQEIVSFSKRKTTIDSFSQRIPHPTPPN